MADDVTLLLYEVPQMAPCPFCKKQVYDYERWTLVTYDDALIPSHTPCLETHKHDMSELSNDDQ